VFCCACSVVVCEMWKMCKTFFLCKLELGGGSGFVCRVQTRNCSSKGGHIKLNQHRMHVPLHHHEHKAHNTTNNAHQHRTSPRNPTGRVCFFLFAVCPV